jgi:CelD/BcsL family acetyltransferase involved in cellulose biosynthesis
MSEQNGVHVVVRSELGPLAERWDELVDRLPLPSPFLRSWWLRHAAGRRPRFVLVLQDGALLGGLALQEGRWLGVPRLRMLGAGALCPDHLDAVASPGREDEVLAALAAWLRRPGARLLDLDGVAADARVAAALPGRVRREVIAVARWTPLPDDPDAWLGARSRNFRANLRKATARLGREAVSYQVARDAAVDAALASLQRLHLERWGGRSMFLAAYKRFAAAARAGAARGEFAVHELAADGTVIASVCAFEVAGRVSLYQGGRSPARQWRDASTVLLATLIEDACRRGFGEADLLRGDEQYKRRLAPATRELVRLRAAHGTAGRLALLTLVLATASRRLAGRALRRLRPRLPRRRPIRPAPAEAKVAAQGVGAHHAGLGPVDQRRLPRPSRR